MSPKTKVVTFRPEDEVHEAMTLLRERDGVPFSEQVRRGLRDYLESKGVLKKAAKRPARTGRKA